MNKIVRLICVVLYYSIARHLPEHSLPRGRLWLAIRRALVRRMLRHAGKNLHINAMAQFGKGDKLSMGDHSSLGYGTRIIGDVTFGNYVGTAQEVIITSSNRIFNRTDEPMMFQGKRPDMPVVIDDDVIIFARAIILPGVHIHSGCVIAAGAVVARDVPPNSIVAGNPAKVVKFRVPPPPDADYSKMMPIACKMPAPIEDGEKKED